MISDITPGKAQSARDLVSIIEGVSPVLRESIAREIVEVVAHRPIRALWSVGEELRAVDLEELVIIHRDGEICFIAMIRFEGYRWALNGNEVIVPQTII